MRVSIGIAVFAASYAAAVGQMSSQVTGKNVAVEAVGQAAGKVTAKDVSIGDPLALTFYLSPTNAAAAEAKAQSIQTPGAADYHKFLTVAQFVSKYTVTDAQLKQVEDSLTKSGFTVGYVYPNHLAIEVTTTVGTAQSVLGVQMKQFQQDGRVGMASMTPVTLPSELKGIVRGVGGLNTMMQRKPMYRVKDFGVQRPAIAASGKLVGGTPGSYLPADFAKFYHVNPLYDYGFSGRGSTIGIVTLNTFDPTDAYSFWKQIGLKVSQTRITTVNVDGGLTAASNNPNGEGETDLDVEYSGALAPNAKIRVYISPNITEANFINGFEAAASENVADTISTSWGEPELAFFYDVATQTPAETGLLLAYHDAFLEMALQGQTLYSSSGDSGAFDTEEGCGSFGTPTAKTPVCNAPYAVDHPSSDPLVTAVGGTTLPYEALLQDGVVLTVKKEQAWGWDYIAAQAAEQGYGADIPLSAVFSVGGGGGVSSFFPVPWYQAGLNGITKTKPGQFFAADFGTGSQIQTILPSGFAGRNSPDVSANADPFSGYQYVQQGVAYNGNGGTSFVGPQMNGVTALYVEALGERMGQINPALYKLGTLVSGDIKAGDNWGYAANARYDNATGVGTLNAAELLLGLAALHYSK